MPTTDDGKLIAGAEDVSVFDATDLRDRYRAGNAKRVIAKLLQRLASPLRKQQLER